MQADTSPVTHPADGATLTLILPGVFFFSQHLTSIKCNILFVFASDLWLLKRSSVLSRHIYPQEEFHTGNHGSINEVK